MEELKVLGPTLLKRKRHSIPVGIRYWLFFKRHILEKPQVRGLFEKELTREEFASLVKQHANPMKYGPSFCRRKRSEATNARNTNDMLAALYRYHAALLAPASPICTKESKAAGLGIFLRTGGRKVAAKQGTPLLEEHLFGTLFELTSKEEVEELRNEGYPSLLEVAQTRQNKGKTSPNDAKTEAKVYAVCGPLSLVNHDCGAPLRFTLPRSMMPREEGKEFHGLQAIYAQPVAERVSVASSAKNSRWPILARLHFREVASVRSVPRREIKVEGENKNCFCLRTVGKGSANWLSQRLFEK